MAGYGTDDGMTAWLTANGLTLPVGSPAPAILRQRGSVYLDGLYGDRFKGVPTGGYAQERAWPRTGVIVHGTSVPDDAIPVQVEQASYAAAFQEASSPGSLSVAASAAGAVKRERVDVIDTEYFAGSGNATADATIRLSAVEGLLAPFLKPAEGAGVGLWAVGGPCA